MLLIIAHANYVYIDLGYYI